MKITLESTTRIVQMNGIECRVWEGKSEGGAPCIAFITRIAVKQEDDHEQFKLELKERRAPTVVWPLRMVL